MSLSLVQSDFKKCVSALAENQLLVCLKSNVDVSKIKELNFQCVDSFKYKEAGLQSRLYVGNQNRLILAYDYCPESSGLENRWMISRHFRNFSILNSSSNISFYCKGSDLDLAVVEDLICSRADHLYEFKNQKYVAYCKELPDKLRNLTPYGFSFRKWVNENPDYLTSIEIGKRMNDFCESIPEITFKTLDEPLLAKEQMNLLLLVGRASTISPPRLHIAQYVPRKKSKKSAITLIGKGITFDSGGINVKPFEGHVNAMKNDMGGAALAWHIFKYLVETEVDREVTVVIPTCENSVDQLSMKPGDIVTSHSGRKVIIDHTDAEGRLILADAISYAQTKLKSKKLFTMATLTTAALQQYGCYTTPVFFMSTENQKLLAELSSGTGEDFCFQDSKLWYTRANQHVTGALTNRGRIPSAGEMGGRSNTAAHFLNSFSNVELSHFDIFNTVWNWSGDYPGHAFGATGANLKTLCKFFVGAT